MSELQTGCLATLALVDTILRGNANMSKLLEALQPGDVIDVVAPASRFPMADLNRAVKMLRRMGFYPRVPRNILRPTALHANRDEVRLAHLKRALLSPDSAAVWCARGGYGSMRLLPAMKKWSRPKRAKILIGFSDITSLHTFVNQEWNWPSLHASVLVRLGRGEIEGREFKSLMGLLTGRSQVIDFLALRPLNSIARRNRSISGVVRGGNMAVLQAGLGTPFKLHPKDSILFFEDIGERPHRVDRMLTQMTQAGFFNQARAVVFGDFELDKAEDRRVLMSEVFKPFAQSVKIPVVMGMPVGHHPKRQMPLPLNTRAHLYLGARPRLQVHSGWI